MTRRRRNPEAHRPRGRGPSNFIKAALNVGNVSNWMQRRPTPMWLGRATSGPTKVSAAWIASRRAK